MMLNNNLPPKKEVRVIDTHRSPASLSQLIFINMFTRIFLRISGMGNDYELISLSHSLFNQFHQEYIFLSLYKVYTAFKRFGANLCFRELFICWCRFLHRPDFLQGYQKRNYTNNLNFLKEHPVYFIMFLNKFD